MKSRKTSLIGSPTRRDFLMAALSSLAWPLAFSSKRDSFAASHSNRRVLFEQFAHPANEFRGTAMWSYDISRTSREKIVSGVTELAKNDFGGFLIVNEGASSAALDDGYLKFGRQFMGLHPDGLEYMGTEFFAGYSDALKTGADRGML